MIKGSNSRREFIRNAAVLTGSLLLLDGCSGNSTAANDQNSNQPVGEKEKKGGEKEVTAAEDLMREHGILRRALLVYGEAAVRLHQNPAGVPPDALFKTAHLFRTFGEDYHEKKLEEAFIFPTVKQKGGEAGGLADILAAQHQRGREITDYIIAVTNAGKIGANAVPLADTLYNFIRMYEHHAAREDTIVFPAWKDALSDEQYDELTDKFEDIEHEQFGEDGFEDAEKQISEIESSMGLGDLSQLTAPPPPALK
jgi:hemerythrin-like domain-containing protein